MLPVRLSDVGPLPLEQITAITLALAQQVEALHAAGTVHGHVRPSRVTLTGATVELDPPDGVGFSKPHDVRSLAELTLWLLSRSGLPAAGAFSDVLRAAAALDPSERPTAERLVQELERVAASPDAPPSAIAASRSAPPVRALVAGVMTVGAVALAAVTWSHDPRAAPAAPAEPPVTSAHTPARSVSPLPAQVWPHVRSACAEAASPLAGDLDGDGCDEEVRFDSGRFAGSAGTVEVIGIAATHHVTGDWHCDGRSTLAMLDPASGAVFVFPRWARPGEDVHAIAVAEVSGATSLVGGDVDGDDCDDLRAVTGNGETVQVDVTTGDQP